MGISVNIIAGPDEESSGVTATGSVEHVISDEEITTFALGDKELKDAVEEYFGKRPNDAFLHSPTPWGDLYKTYGWSEVQTVLEVKDASILGITSEPTIVKTQEFVNNSKKKGIFNVGITESVAFTASSNWSIGGTLTIGQTFSYDVSFGKGETSLSYSQSWGIGEQHSEAVTIGSTSGLTVELGPGEGVLVELSASRGTMRVRVNYNAYLIGRTAVNYDSGYKGHHYWAFSISRVMAAGGISNSVTSTEDIEIGYYSNAKVELKDRTSRELIASYPLFDEEKIDKYA